MPTETSVKIKILLIENEERWITIFQNIVKNEPNIQIIDVARNVRKALDCLMAHSDINLVVMDYELDDRELWGAELTKKVLQLNPKIKLFFWSIYISFIDRKSAKDAGAHGYVSKLVPDRDVNDAIYKIMGGKEQWVIKIKEDSPPFDLIKKNQLSSMETKVMEQLAQGKSYKQIARFLLWLEYNKKIEELGQGKVSRDYGTFEQYLTELPESLINNQEEQESSSPSARTMMDILDPQPARNHSSERRDLKRSRLDKRAAVVPIFITNIKKKLTREKLGRDPEESELPVLAELVRIAVTQFDRLENHREISYEEIINLMILEWFLEDNPIKGIAEEFSKEETEIERIIQETKSKALGMHRKGASIEQIAKEFSIDESQAQRIIQAN